jgi:hypothetical protein
MYKYLLIIFVCACGISTELPEEELPSIGLIEAENVEENVEEEVVEEVFVPYGEYETNFNTRAVWTPETYSEVFIPNPSDRIDCEVLEYDFQKQYFIIVEGNRYARVQWHVDEFGIRLCFESAGEDYLEVLNHERDSDPSDLETGCNNRSWTILE